MLAYFSTHQFNEMSHNPHNCNMYAICSCINALWGIHKNKKKVLEHKNLIDKCKRKLKGILPDAKLKYD